MCQPYPGGARMPQAQRSPAPASILSAAKALLAAAAYLLQRRGA